MNKCADINKGDVTPLFYACLNPYCPIDIIELLIKKGADPNQRCLVHDSYVTLLYRLIYHYEKDLYHVIKYLLENGADPNKPAKDNENSQTPIYEAVRQFHKNQSIYFQLISLLLEKGANPNVIYNEESPLTLAIHKHKNFELIKLLIKYGADVNEKINDNSNKAPLCLCCRFLPKYEVLQFLLNHGANPKLPHQNDPISNLFNFINKNNSKTNKTIDESLKLLIQKGAQIQTNLQYQQCLNLAKNNNNKKLISLINENFQNHSLF